LSSAVADLVKTYDYQNAVQAVARPVEPHLQRGSGPGGILARVFVVIEQTDENIKVHQLFRRACCYVFAQLHQKGSSTDWIAEQIENDVPHIQDARTKVYNILRVGRKWGAIVEQFASIVNRTPQQLTGLLCLLESASA
jgi:hypothetical protein